MKPGPIERVAQGVMLLRDRMRNKGRAFTGAEREELGLCGLFQPLYPHPRYA